MKNIRTPTVVGLIKAEIEANKTLPDISSADAGKLATVDSNGKWAAANLTVGQGEVAVDSTLLVSGAAADAKVTGDNVAELKSAVSEYTFYNGYVNLADNTTTLNAPTANNAYRTLTLNVLPGETISIKGIGGAGAAKLWGTADINKKILRRSAASASGEFTITIQEGEAFFVYNTSYSGTFYCIQEGCVPLVGKAIEAVNNNADDIAKNTASISVNENSISNINKNLLAGKMPYIHAYMKSLSTTNYLAVVIPSSVLKTTGNTISFDCYCEDSVSVYYMVYNVDLTQTGNDRLTTSLKTQSYTSNKTGNWYYCNNENWGTISSPAGQYVALVFNAVRTDDIKTLTELYFKNIVINGTLIDSVINQVFLYSADATALDITKLYDMNVISVADIIDSKVGNGRILCIGDSLTAGTYATDETVHVENYPYYMGRIVGNLVVNKGAPGYSASMYWNNSILSAADFTDVKHIIIMLGTNGGLTDTLETDVFAYDDYADYANTKTGCYCKIIEYCMEQAPNAQIYLCTTPYVNGDLQPGFLPPTTPSANAVIPKIAEFYHFPVIDVRNGMGINEKNTLVFQSDGVHGDSGFYQKLGTFIGSQFKALASFIVT